MKACPLPTELAYLEPVLRGPMGQAMLTSIMACYEEGFSRSQLAVVIQEVISFYAQEYHRCNACHGWTNEPTAGALVIDGRFLITAFCPKCAALGAAGRPTEAMTRNMQEYVFGGAA